MRRVLVEVKDAVLTAIILACLYLLTSCSPCKTVGITTTEKEYLRDTVVSFVPKYFRDTVTVVIPALVDSIEPNYTLEESYLENDYCFSYASVTALGYLSHSLTSKQDSIPVRVVTKTVYSDRVEVQRVVYSLYKKIMLLVAGCCFGVLIAFIFIGVSRV